MLYDKETVEALAMVLCPCCSDKKLRWRDRTDGTFCHQQEFFDQEGIECEASAMLEAAMSLGIEIDTGAHLEFPEADHRPACQ
jgi:hypothetical protein